jgi:hypothetical protein
MWLDETDQDTYEQVIAAVGILVEEGPHLGRPLVDSVKGSRFKNMKELRPGSAGRSEVRILFAFDPHRRAILLTAGDKARKWDRWYQTNIPLADDLFAAHVEGLER